MQVPHLGTVIKDPRFNRYSSKPISVPVLGNKLCRIVLEGYDEDQNKEQFHTAIANFLSIDKSVLKAAASHVFQYYKDCNAYWKPGDEQFLIIASPDDVWDHVRFGDEPMVSRRAYRDNGIYISLECGCDWEKEHGLQI